MESLKDKIERHGAAVLNFSGGKDSLATLELCKPYLDKITILFGATGDEFPHVTKFVQETMARYNVKNFVTVRPPKPFHRALIEDGLPGDVVPSSCSPVGRFFHRTEGVLVRSWFCCCADNLWHPLLKYAKENGFSLVIRGQRDSEPAGGVGNGHIEDGVEFCFPLTEWSEERVFSFIEDRGLRLPMHYYEGVVDSLDCMHCTAPFYAGRKSAIARFKFMKKYYPLQYTQVVSDIKMLKQLAQKDIDGVQDILTGGEQS